MLQSYGIETAEDIVERSILAVPGFGPVYTNNLLRWRKTIEQRFVFDATRGIDPTDLAALNKELDEKRGKLEQELQGGATQLKYVAQQIKAQRQILGPALHHAYRTLAQTEMDFKATQNLISRR